jgi:hypothetical protein
MKRLETTLIGGTSGCVLSDDDRYRYVLWRTWDTKLPELAVCMLNPSTADHQTNDATIRTLLRLAGAWGYGGIRVVNLFALRATDPRQLRKADDPVGPDNDAAIAEVAANGATVLAAWGSQGSYLDRAARVLAGPLKHSLLKCLGRTASGQPKHPLYSRSDAQLEDYRPC